MAQQYPECEKMAAVEDESQTIGDFLEWLGCVKEVSLCHLIEGEDEMEYDPIHIDTEQLLVEYFHINLKKVEEERRQMIMAGMVMWRTRKDGKTQS